MKTFKKIDCHLRMRFIFNISCFVSFVSHVQYLDTMIKDIFYDSGRFRGGKSRQVFVTLLTSTAKQVLGNCERMVLASFIENRLSIFSF